MAKALRIGIYDIDGCVADSTKRLRKYIDTEALRNGDYTKFVHSFLPYSLSNEGDVKIPQGAACIEKLAEIYQVDKLVALTARDDVGRKETIDWLQENLPWDVSESDVIMHYGRHFGRGEAALARALNVLGHWGYVDFDTEPKKREVEWEGDIWKLPCYSREELFSSVSYKRGALAHLREKYDVAFAVDDNPGIVEMYYGCGVDAYTLRFPEHNHDL